jgi:hypothetical protein
MSYTRSTIKQLPKHARSLARLINELDSTLNGLKHYLPIFAELEQDVNALYNRMSIYDKKHFEEQKMKSPLLNLVEEPDDHPIPNHTPQNIPETTSIELPPHYPLIPIPLDETSPNESS